MSAHPAFGKPWAADGETRPHRFRTPLAWATGIDDGMLLVAHGADDERWMRMSTWLAWVKETDAKPVEMAEDAALPKGEPPWSET